jgi:carboxymethylenebutenolidase
VAHGEMVSFTTPHGQTQGYLEGRGAGTTGIVVIQEYWGLVPHIKDLAGRFAAEGYVALAPDLYHGKTTVDAEEASHLLAGLDWGRAVAELSAGIKYLQEKEGVTRVGVAGFCMGGALAILAAQDPAVTAYVAFYGFPPNARLGTINAPGLIMFGEHEQYFPVDEAKAFADAQQRRGVPTEFVIHPGAGHAFFNDARPEAYHPEAARNAWSRTLNHFERHLRQREAQAQR